MAMCVIAVVGDAPCQCRSPGANHTTSPVNQSAGPLLEGCEPARVMFMVDSHGEQRLDRPALVHRAVALGRLLQRQRLVEDLAGVNCAVEYKVDEVREVTTHRGRAAVQMDLGEEQLESRQLD